MIITMNELTTNSSLNDLLASAWLISQYSRSFSTGIGLMVTNLPGPTTSANKSVNMLPTWIHFHLSKDPGKQHIVTDLVSQVAQFTNERPYTNSRIQVIQRYESLYFDCCVTRLLPYVQGGTFVCLGFLWLYCYFHLKVKNVNGTDTSRIYSTRDI